MMSKFEFKRESIILACFFAVITAIFGFGIHIWEKRVSQDLERYALEQSIRWVRFLESGQFASERTDSNVEAASHNHPEQLSLFSQIFRYEFYDSDFKLLSTTGDTRWLGVSPLRKPFVRGALATLETGRQNLSIGLFNGDGNLAPQKYSIAVLPIFPGNAERRFIAIYTDQTRLRNIVDAGFDWVMKLAALFFFVSGSALVIAVISGIHKLLNAKAQLQKLENKDSLTGLTNRESFLRDLSNLMGVRRGMDTQLAVIFLDIDKFKEVNDMLSHNRGDELLMKIASRLQSVCRPGDLVARLSGDEFAIACLGISEEAEIRKFLNNLRHALNEPYIIDGEEVVCTLSMGISIAPNDGDTADILMKSADLALCRSKDEGRNTFRFFDPHTDKSIQRKRELEHQLSQAINLNQLEVYYQPQFEVATGRLAGAEALLRWDHPEHGIIAPSHFISVAESSGQIVSLGEWTLRTACQTAAKWSHPYKVAVNLSPVQFQNISVSELVADVLMETGLDPARLELELTESLLMSDTDMVIEEFFKLKSLGVAIAIDDFGTGYSSLSYLSEFKFDKLKIDKSFIRNLENDTTGISIVKTIIGLGKALNVKITAEGVERINQAEILKSLGCDQVQGFLYGLPETAQDYSRIMASEPDQVDESISIFAA